MSLKHEITMQQLVGEYRTVLASDSSVPKRLEHILVVREDKAASRGAHYLEGFYVTTASGAVLYRPYLPAAIELYNQQ